MKYEIKGENLPVVICTLESGETLISESGGMSWMSENIKMETSGGGAGKIFGRLLSGDSIIQNYFTAEGGPGLIAFASSFPGSIRALQITPENPMIVQKKAFLASEKNIELSIHFRKKFSSGLFGGEGFIMQKLSGEGIAFIEIDGSAIEYNLEAGQKILVSTGHLAAMDSTCSMEIVSVKGVSNVLFGGEGLFHTEITGPGRVILQTMPMQNVALQLAPYFASTAN